MSSRKSLEVERGQGVALVKLLGPGKGNAMGPDFFREMPLLFEELGADDEVRAIVIRGAGDHFSYGLDLGAVMGELGPHLLGPQMAAQRTGLLDKIREFQEAASCVERCRKPVIAAIAGWCIGGGLDLAAACDIRICSAGARFSLREVRVAIVADLGSLQRLPAIIGEGATRELAFTGKDIDAERAAGIGLVNRVLPDDGALYEEAMAMALEIAENPPIVVQGIKEVLGQPRRRAVAEALDFVAVWNAAFLQSMDLSEALAAFREKREPRFKGR